MATIHHLDLYGKRQSKYDTLESLTIENASWTELSPTGPHYFFAQIDYAQNGEYQKGFSVAEVFPINSVGVVTAKDSILINDSKIELMQHVEEHYQITANMGKIKQIDYRPFDKKYVYYDNLYVERPREKVMRHMIQGENLGLIIKRQSRQSFSYSFISKNIVEGCLFESAFANNSILPLYIYSDESQSPLPAGGERIPNLDPTIWNRINEVVGETTPEEILDYIYAVLHSPSYREKYKEFLKIDFPRVPYPKDRESFDALVKLGGELRVLHLLESPKVEEYITTFPVAGTNEVGKVSFRHPELDSGSPSGRQGMEDTETSSVGQVWINDAQYFGDVPCVAWEFYIGGYQPAQKWLKDRKGRTLTWEDIAHYQSMIVALTETARVMREVDRVLEV